MPSKTAKKAVDPDEAYIAKLHAHIDAMSPEEVRKLHPADRIARLERLVDQLPYIRLGDLRQ